ncbi:MAG: peptidoglycan-binding protein [Rhodobacteraceae bacterium]|nr:peptidoglycan-binding protein [Paracoccaceae bacterium]
MQDTSGGGAVQAQRTTIRRHQRWAWRAAVTLGAGLIAACSPVIGQFDTAPRMIEPEIVILNDPERPVPAPGECWARDRLPAVVETITLQRAEPGPDGTTVFRTDTRQQIVDERRSLWFQVPCAGVQDAAFRAALQRALAARDLYAGPVTGEIDGPTRTAIRRFQQGLGLNSSTLSLAAAQSLGLLPVTLEQPPRPGPV